MRAKSLQFRKKTLGTGVFLILLLIISGIVLMYRGHDAVALGKEQKEGILTAEQVKMSFDSVNGRLLRQVVHDGDYVEKGDVVMELDPIDTDLSIKKCQAQIAQLSAQIDGTRIKQGISYQKADTDDAQTSRQIDQQRAAVTSASSQLKNAQIDYDRKSYLVSCGAIAQSQLDDAEMALSVAQANVEQQQELLSKALAANNGSGTDSIAQARQSAANMNNDIKSLEQQKRALEVQLEQLQVQRERLVLRAPESGKVLKVLAQEGEMVQANTPVVLLESDRSYYDIYVSEDQARHLTEGQEIMGTAVANHQQVKGYIHLLTKAPSFADLKQSREKSQADLSSFQVRIYIEPQDGIQTGMTIGVNEDAFSHK